MAAGFLPVAGIDVNPDLGSSDLGVLAGALPLGVSTTAHLEQVPHADVAFLCTGSDLTAVTPLLLQLAEQRLNVVSTCEELSYPWHLNPMLADEINARATECGVAIVGTGINPGFVLDTLILDLARASNDVSHVLGRRRVDLGTRRAQLRQKAGVGLTPDEFAANAPNLGHVGLV